MAPSDYTEGTLVQQATAEYLQRELGWASVYAWNDETFGPDGTLGRASDQEVVLARPLREKLVELNPGLPDEAYDDAVRIPPQRGARIQACISNPFGSVSCSTVTLRPWWMPRFASATALSQMNSSSVFLLSPCAMPW